MALQQTGSKRTITNLKGPGGQLVCVHDMSKSGIHSPAFWLGKSQHGTHVEWVVQPALPEVYIFYLKQGGFTEMDPSEKPLIGLAEGMQIVNNPRTTRSFWGGSR